MVELTKKGIAGAPAVTEKTDEIAAAGNKDIGTSGAIVEPGAKDVVDMNHPAVDANPRARMPVDSNRIDFNDPGLPGHEAVVKSLQDQGKA